MAGRLAGTRRETVFGRLSASGEKWPALTAAGGRACRCDRAGSGEQARRLTGLLRPTQEQHKSGSRRHPTREQHGRNGIPRHTLARVLKSLCQPNYQDGCALAGLTDQYSPGGIGSDRPSEKRKVGSSTLPLTTMKVFTFDLRLSSRLGLTFPCAPGVFPAGAGFRAGCVVDVAVPGSRLCLPCRGRGDLGCAGDGCGMGGAGVMAARRWRRGWRGSCGGGAGFSGAGRRRRGGRCLPGGRPRRSGCAGCGRPAGR